MTYSMRQYKLFISHAWDYGGDYDNLVNLLKSDVLFRWTNLSVPEEDKLPSHPTLPKSYRFLVRQLDDRIMQSDCLLVIAAMYLNHRGWIQSEIEAALEYEKPIIAVRPWDSERIPSQLLGQVGVTDFVGWNAASIIASIRKHATLRQAGPNVYEGSEMLGFYLENMNRPKR